MGAGNLKWDIVPSDASNDPVVQSDLGNVLQPGIIGSVKDLALPEYRTLGLHRGQRLRERQPTGNAVRVRRI